jgi:uncharacterized membrane protein
MRARTIVWTSACVYAVVLFGVGVIRYRIFRAQVDLGLFTQVVASSLGSFSSTAEGVNNLAVNFSPILFLCAPLLWIAHTPLALSAIQATASALIAPAVYLLAMRRFAPRAAMLAAFAALTYPPLIALTVGDFHELAFAPATILWLAWALDARRFRTASLLAALALTIKEDVVLVLAVLSFGTALWAARRGDRELARFCSRLGIVAIALFVVYFAAIRPAVAGPAYARMTLINHYYDWHYAGPSPRGFAVASSPIRAWYLASVFGPLLALPLLSPAIVLAMPGLVEILASHEAITLDLSTHYAAVWLPYVLLAFVFGVARIARRSMLLAYVSLSAVIASSIWIDAYASPAQWWYQIYRMPTQRDARLDGLLQSLPHDAVIATDLNLFAHLGFDVKATIRADDPDIAVVDRRCDSDYCKTQTFPSVDALVKRGALRLARSAEGLEVYVRVAGRKRAPHNLRGSLLRDRSDF